MREPITGNVVSQAVVVDGAIERIHDRDAFYHIFAVVSCCLAWSAAAARNASLGSGANAGVVLAISLFPLRKLLFQRLERGQKARR